MNDDQDDEKSPPMPLSDITTLLVCLAFLAGFLWLMFGPSPFAGFTETAPPQEVTVTLPGKAK
ncbi:MAG TPA: hypothetical protein VGC27_02045 [Rhizomicrobium sp.]